MKKIMVFVLVGIYAMCLSSCNSTEVSEFGKDTTEINEDVESTYDSSVSTDLSGTVENITTYPPATVPSITTESNIPIISTEYEDTFESFMEIEGSLVYEMFKFKSAILIPETRWSALPALAFFRVTGIEEKNSGVYMRYRIQFIDSYGWDSYNTEMIYGKEYTLSWLGHLDEQLYGRPPLEVGKVYAKIMTASNEHLENNSLIQAGLIYKVTEEDGKRYIYGYGMDLSEMECKILITDPEENCPYEKGKHDKAIAYLESIGQPLPTFDYKCETDDFYAELERRCSK